MSVNCSPQKPGDGCEWCSLQGNLETPPKFVLAFDENLNVQAFYNATAGGHPIDEKDWPAPKDPDAEVHLMKHGTNTVVCVNIAGVLQCFETG